MKLVVTLSITLLGSGWLLHSTEAFPTGAGRCTRNVAAPAPHGGLESVLAAGGYTVTVGGTQVLPGAGAATVTAGEAFDIALTGPDFRGFLISLPDEAEGDLVGPDDGVSKQADGTNCQGVAAITHTSNDLKQGVTLTGTVVDPKTTQIEVNVVVQNSGGVSIYHYDWIDLEVVELAAPTGNVTVEPTDAGTAEPTGDATVEPGTAEPTETAQPTGTQAPTGSSGTDSLADVALAEDDLSTLVETLVTAGLVENLSAPGSFTVFAPVNSAFENFDDQPFLARLLTEDWKMHLRALLLYHVADEQYGAADLSNGQILDTVLDTPVPEQLTVGVGPDGVTISGPAYGDANVLQANFFANNGVLHKVDRVFVPTILTVSVLQAASALPGFSQIATFVVAAGLEETLTNELVTVFGPTDDAFEDLPAETLQLLSDTDALSTALRNHIVEGLWYMARLTPGTELTSLAGNTLTITEELVGDRFPQTYVNGALIEDFDAVAANGLAHVISAVLLPGNETEATAPPETTTAPPETTTAPPESTTAPPEATAAPGNTTAAPETATDPPILDGPDVTTPAPSPISTEVDTSSSTIVATMIASLVAMLAALLV